MKRKILFIIEKEILRVYECQEQMPKKKKSRCLFPKHPSALHKATGCLALSVCSVGKVSTALGTILSHTVQCLRCLFWKQIHLLLKKQSQNHVSEFPLRDLNS